ncbi:MAG: endonuclease [Solirubrobacteraceae bacterium]|jgi:endonuclease-8|nr:endonuclease [Solirubrobacteraceae bacterium]
MAEGDTIHFAAARIRAALAGRVPEEIVTPQPRHRAERWPQRLAGRTLEAVDAHGKHLFLRFEEGLTLHSHLRMTGAWAVHGEGERWHRARARAWLLLRGGGREIVEFDGPLLELAPDRRLRAHPRLTALGPDVLGESFDFERFLRRLRREDPARPIGDALLDQRILAGIGNVWKAESCFAVGIDPWRALSELRDDEAFALVRFARENMRRSAESGFAARPSFVYGRAGRPCPRCGSPVRRRSQGENNRLTFWCAGCQS